jgi:hypothetical protein
LTLRKSKSLLAYCAGIIDGEGCITISRCKDRSKRYPRYEAVLAVRMTTPAPMRILAALFGGKVKPYTWTKKHQKHYKRYWHWYRHATNAADTVAQLLPFLRVKHRQAKLLLRFRKAVSARKNKYYSLVERKKLERLRNRMRVYNA